MGQRIKKKSTLDSVTHEEVAPPSKEKLVDVTNIECEDDNIEIVGKHNPYSITMYLSPNADAKHIDRFIKSVEKMIRTNDDYKMWLESLRDHPSMSQDAFLSNITSQEAEIQLHHFPLSLYSIVSAVLYDAQEKEEKISTFILADKVIKHHMDGIIGLVPLTTTMHEMAHLGVLKFTRQQVFGKWEAFYNTYKPYFTEYDHTVVRDLVGRKALDRNDPNLLAISHKPKTTKQ